MQMLPGELGTAMLIEVDKHGTYQGLKLFVRERVQMLLDHADRHRTGNTNLVDTEVLNWKDQV